MPDTPESDIVDVPVDLALTFPGPEAFGAALQAMPALKDGVTRFFRWLDPSDTESSGYRYKLLVMSTEQCWATLRAVAEEIAPEDPVAFLFGAIAAIAAVFQADQFVAGDDPLDRNLVVARTSALAAFSQGVTMDLLRQCAELGIIRGPIEPEAPKPDREGDAIAREFNRA